MTYQEKLIMFVQLKNEIIEKESGIKYINEIDIGDIERWLEKTCKKIYKELIQTIQKGACRLKTSTCIWCLKYEEICFHCTYADRHGRCGNGSSSYDYYNSISAMLFTNKTYKDILKKIKDKDELSLRIE